MRAIRPRHTTVKGRPRRKGRKPIHPTKKREKNVRIFLFSDDLVFDAFKGTKI
jgi:hypothetical protein